ncbi:MAG: hypothetical protein U5J64_06795 [Halobacteriales archaeon]|nr:hypothetical protein [Halobacteriales archaeon]
MTKTSKSSWTQLTNRAGGNNKPSSSGSSNSTPNFGAVPVVESEDIEVREEAVKSDFCVKGDGCGNEAPYVQYESKKMFEAVTDFREWAEDEVSVVLESEDGDLITVGSSHRFAAQYRRRQYARLQQLSRNIQESYGKLLHTVMLTFTASNRKQSGGFIGYIDHLDELLSSWNAVRRELHRTLEGYEWEYIGILEPHRSGYAHLHLAVFVRGMVKESDFSSVMSKHVNSCDLANKQAHKDSISVSRSADHGEDTSTNLGAYLAAYMGDSLPEDGDEDDAERWTDDYDNVPAHVLRFWTTLWLSQRQQFRPSNGAQEYMQKTDENQEEEDSEHRDETHEESDEDEYKEPNHWVMIGISTDGPVSSVDDDCFYRVSGTPGRVDTATIGSLNEEAYKKWCDRLYNMRH